MSKKHHGGPAPVPPGNRAPIGPGGGTDGATVPDPDGGEPFSEQDPQRRLGNYQTAGEHAIQQPGALNDGGSASRKG